MRKIGAGAAAALVVVALACILWPKSEGIGEPVEAVRLKEAVAAWQRPEVESGRETIIDVDFGGPSSIAGAFSRPEDLKWFVQVCDESIPADDKLRAMAGKFEETGRYVIDDLAPGTYMISAIARTDEDVVLEDSRQVTLAPGETLTLDFSL
ncbi:MAG: carboxypeptidase-like regulatory domain-containing protein [Candidatus Hydrogenedentales bacterium]